MEQMIGKRPFTLTLANNVQSAEMALLSDTDGIELYKVDLSFKALDGDCAVTIKWHAPIRNTLSFWCPTYSHTRRMNQWFARCKSESSFANGAPEETVFSEDGTNYLTAALSEAELETRLTACVNDFDEKDELDFTATIFERVPPIEKCYSFLLRIDTRAIPFEDCVAEISAWWKEFYPNNRALCAVSERPLYSSWYNYHQNPLQESLMKELEPASDMGFKSLIIDDGWSYAGPGSSAYDDIGTWAICKEKFPDFAAFVKKCHELDIKPSLWFPVAFVGVRNPDYAVYKDYLLYTDEGLRAGVLDPRYPHVREYILSAYRAMVRDYGLDGLKLDFIDSFREIGAHVVKEGMDCETVEEGVNLLLKEVLSAFGEDFFIEFRQNYVGPSITRYCNMLRAGDCAFDPITNRVRTIDLRMMDYPLAVHADMFMWAKEEAPESCAAMLENTLFSVPQISVRLQNTTKTQMQAIRTYVSYWDEHRDILLHGHLHIYGAASNYTAASSENDALRIVALYEKRDYVWDGKACDIFNAFASDSIYIECAEKVEAKVVDCYGNALQKMPVEGVMRITVPQGGRVELR